jgi:hypothetical protein
LANDKAKPDAVKGPGEVTAKLDRVPEEKAETRTVARTSLQHSLNRTIRFPQSDHPVSSGSG